MIGPASSGRSAAIIMTCHPAWQLPMTTGLPSASGWRAVTASTKIASARHTSSTVWPGTGFGQEAHEVAGMAGLQRHADLAVMLHAADARAVAGAGIDDDERPLGGIDAGSLRRYDADQRVVHRPRQRASIDQSSGVKLSTFGASRALCSRAMFPR